MPKLINQTTGYLSQIIQGDEKYSIHLNVPGVILLLESKKKFPGKQFIYLFTNTENFITYFHTSCGTVHQEDNKLIFKSNHTCYEFIIDESCLDEIEKKEIFLNVFFNHKLEKQ